MGNFPYSGPLGRGNPLIRDAGIADPRGLAAGDPSAGDLPGGDPTILAIPYEGEELAAELLGKVFAGLPGAIAVRLWGGAAFRVGGDAQEAPNGRGEPRFV